MNTYRFILSSSSFNRIAGVSLFAMLAVLMLGLVGGPTVRAQQSPTPAQETEQQMVKTSMPDAWRTNFGEQAAHLLRSGSEATRSMMLQNVVHLAASDPSEIDLSAAAPALLDIYARSPNEGHRFMAATALHGIAKQNNMVVPMMETLGELLTDERSPRVREHTLNVLVDYASHLGEPLPVSHEVYLELKRHKRAG
jgi:hypothetical protein